MKEIEGDHQGHGLRIALVAARFNQFITNLLLDGARSGLSTHGVREEDTVVLRVPGAFELPLIAKTLAGSGRYDAVVCLGSVIRGETTHYDLVSGQAASGVASVSLETEVPVIFGVLTTENIDQAINRAGGKMGNVGYDAALSAIEMANLMRQARNLEP